ncbi:MAG: hypothetical protein AAGJ40_15515 [Planctomycetota bacterium]
MSASTDILDEFDQQWAQFNGAHLKQFIERVPTGHDDLVQELCAADLEWRWRTKTNAPPLAFDDGGLPSKPTANDYRSLLGGAWARACCRQQLLEAEWCARSIWGDAPHVDGFAKQMPEVHDWKTVLSRKLNDIVPLHVELRHQSGTSSMAARVSHDLVIGRQTSHEPVAPVWVESSARLIIAGAQDRRISRQQLRVRRTRLREVELTNVSTSTGGWWGEYRLDPGESTCIPVPTSIHVGDRIISLSLNDQIALD